MRLLVKSQLRFLTRAPWSTATALFGVALGVASVVAVHLISTEVVRSLEEAAPPHLAGLTHVLERSGLDADDYFELRASWRSAPGSDVRAMVPLLEGYLPHGERRLRVLGADWLAMPAPLERSGRGEPLAVSDDVLVGEAVIVDTDVGASGSSSRDGHITLAGRQYRIASVRQMELRGTVIADIAAAQHMLGLDAQAIDRVGLALEDPWRAWRRRLDRLMPGFAAGLPAPPAGTLADVAPRLPGGDGWRVLPVAAERPEAEFARTVLFNLGALGTLALLVAWFLIYQVGVIWLRRQRLLLERLHVIGVAQNALRSSFVALFLMLGAVATVVGGALGVVLANLLISYAAAGIEAPGVTRASLGSLDAWVVAKALVSGIGICLLGAYWAFAREWQPKRSSVRWRPWVVALLAALLAAGIVFEQTGVLGGFLAILALSLTGVALVGPVVALLRRVIVRVRLSTLTRLALRDVAWYPQMLGVALAALSLAVATAIGIAVMVESFRADFDRMLAVRLAGDLYVEVSAGEAETVAGWLERQPEVTRISLFGRDRARVAGVPVELGYSHFDAAESARYGYSGALRPGEALVSERLARDLDLAPGDRVDAAGGSLTVAGTFAGFGDPFGRLLVDVASLDALRVTPRFDRVTVTVSDPAAEVALERRLGDRFQAAAVESRAELRRMSLAIFDRTFAITQALTLLALVVAVVGTYNALTALKLHQAPTAALLRAEGVTAGEIRRIALLRAGTVGGLAMLLAVPLGFVMAWILCAVINPRSFGWTVQLQLAPSSWLPPVLLGMLAAVLAGMLPAPRERGLSAEGT